jgi:hypothetical protein
MATFYNPVRGMIVINSVIVLSTFILEVFFNKRVYTTTTLVYDRLDLLAPDKFQELLSDISSRSGKKVEKVEIKKIDLIKKNAELEISFRSTDTGKQE